MQSSAFVEARRMAGARGEFLFLFNHSAAPADVEYTLALRAGPRLVRELVTGEAMKAVGDKLAVKLTLPAETVRVLRIEY